MKDNSVRGARLARRVYVGVLATGLLLLGQTMVSAQSQGRGQGHGSPSFLDTTDPFGVLRSVTLDGSSLNQTGPFFQSLGTNGRSCVSCHVPSTAWSISPSEVQARFNATQGLDPIFRTNDGANSPLADVSTLAARTSAYSMLLSRGVIRVGQPIPLGAEFTLTAVDDPWGYASANELSLFRRPLPSTNLRFLTGVMWDERESSLLRGTQPIVAPTPGSKLFVLQELLQDFENLFSDLEHQSNDATLGHAQAMVPGLTQLQQLEIVLFEMNLATAQQSTTGGIALNSQGASGGPAALVTQPFYVSINDSAGGDVFGNAFNPSSMTLFNAWQGNADPARASIARGAGLFNTLPLNAGGTTCTTCHGVPNVGNRSLDRPVALGTDVVAQRYSGLPLYTLTNISTGATKQTTDPGIAMVTGLWADVGKFKTPVLRGLAGRAPYFHNGLAESLDDVLNFYQGHFNITFTSDQRADLIAFLQSL